VDTLNTQVLLLTLAIPTCWKCCRQKATFHISQCTNSTSLLHAVTPLIQSGNDIASTSHAWDCAIVQGRNKFGLPSHQCCPVLGGNMVGKILATLNAGDQTFVSFSVLSGSMPAGCRGQQMGLLAHLEMSA
jgi:hypothetical protein